jgi:hypothetical protein
MDGGPSSFLRPSHNDPFNVQGGITGPGFEAKVNKNVVKE